MSRPSPARGVPAAGASASRAIAPSQPASLAPEGVPFAEAGEKAHPAGRPRVPIAFEETIAVAAMALLVLITLSNVLVRYFSDESFAWTEEISIFLMVVMTIAGAAAAASRDRHIRIEYFYDTGSAARRRTLALIGAAATVLLFGGLAVLLGRVAYDEWLYGETSMAIGIPRWWYSIWPPLLSVAAALRALGWGLRRARVK